MTTTEVRIRSTLYCECERLADFSGRRRYQFNCRENANRVACVISLNEEAKPFRCPFFAVNIPVLPM